MTDENNVKGSIETSTVGTDTPGEINAEKTYTEKEVQDLIQREGDRRATQSYKTAKKEFERQIAEAEKLREMDENQRKEYEYSQKLQELEKREHDFIVAQNKLEATKILSNRELPIEFVDYIVAEDADTMLENINVFERMFKAAVADGVAKKIASPAPKGSNVKQSGMTKEEFKKLSTLQQREIFHTNPELYNQLTH